MYIDNIEELDKNEVVPHPHYPFIHGTISAPAKGVSDDVVDIFEISYEDIEPFVNQYVLSDMHNAYCSLTGYDELTKRALDREDSRVLFYEPDELQFMKERGLNEQSPDGYVSFKNVGQLMTKEGDKFVIKYLSNKDIVTVMTNDIGELIAKGATFVGVILFVILAIWVLLEILNRMPTK